MDEEQLVRLARDIDELKAAVKRNDPLLREVLTKKGWALLGLGGGLGVTLFALPAHFLSRAYGSFEAIPSIWRGIVWAALVLAIVGGGAWKLILISRRAAEVDGSSTLGDLMGSFFGATAIHETGGMLVAIAVSVAFSVWVGKPWYALPPIAVVLGIWMNAIGCQTRVNEYLVSGWWSIVTGAVSLFFVEDAPFLWVFIAYGGMFYSFALAVALASRRQRRHGQGTRGGDGGK